MGSRLAVYDREVSTLMRTLRFVVVLAAVGFAAEAVAAEAEPGGGRFAVLVGACGSSKPHRPGKRTPNLWSARRGAML